MKLGDVLKKEREGRGLSSAEVADRLNISEPAYLAIEAGENADFDSAAELVLDFNELITGQVNQLYYPCGIPFTRVRDYEVTR